MLGGLLALISAVSFAVTNAGVRRGVISGTALQATVFSIPVGVPIFALALYVSGHPGVIGELPSRSLAAFAVTGVTHFTIGRYANYRAIGAIGTNLAGPVMQFNLIVSLVLAIALLGEVLTLPRILGILLIFVGPAMVARESVHRAQMKQELAFTPRHAEGYLFASLAALCYGATPVLLRYAAHGRGIDASLAGGLVSTISASFVVAALLLMPRHLREVRAVNAHATRWFLFAAVMVYVSQLFYYMAIALVPVTIVAPISALSNIIRIHVSRWLNPRHEVFGPEVTLATILSFIGVVVLSLSLDALPFRLPPGLAMVLAWHWP